MRKVFVILVGMFICISGYAAVDKALVQSAEKYLNSIGGLQGTFTQIANSKSEQGLFSMLRPGRVRLDYKNAPIQLIADGKDLYFYDKSLPDYSSLYFRYP